MLDPFEIDEHVSRERQKTRELRNSRWWQNKIANQAACNYCKKALKPATATMDHIVPLIRGGTTTKGNVTIACRDCNQKKAHLTPVEWHDYLATVGSPPIQAVVSDESKSQ
jgi:5-methylcytosine-specific restriction protein A